MGTEPEFAELASPYAVADLPPRNARDLEAVYDIPVTVSAVLGRTNDAGKPVAETRPRRRGRVGSQAW